MELIWAVLKLIQYMFVGPLFWVTDNLAGLFFPYEGDSNHNQLSTLFAIIITAALCYGGWLLFS